MDIWTIIFIVVGALCFLGGFYVNYRTRTRIDSVSGIDISKLKIYSERDLTEFNGIDPKKVILIGLNGWVYDVTSGSEFYAKSGPYNYLTGKDSSKELNLVGGEIIKRKYKIVGRLTK